MDKDIYEELIDYMIENQEHFYRIVFTYTGNREDTLDIVQNAVCRALEKSGTIRNRAAMKVWFYKILIHESMRYMKKQKREVTVDNIEKYMPDLSGGTGVEMYDAVNRLKKDVQHVIKLRFYEDMTLNEIAEITGMNINTVKAKLYRGLKKLKQEVK